MLLEIGDKGLRGLLVDKIRDRLFSTVLILLHLLSC